jgi:protein-tyrosine phosphatase
MMPTLTSPSRRSFLRASASAALCSSIGASLLSACGGAGESANVPETPKLSSVENFRDMAGMGDGYPTADGRRVRRGVVYRSGAVSADDHDMNALARLAIRAVHDLRTFAEITLTPDRALPGASRETHEIAFFDSYATAPADAIAARAWMIERQRAMVADPAARAQFGALLTRLARVSGAQVVHGATGKDRTGWASALVLAIADVPLDVIIQDYLATNVADEGRIAARISAHAARLNVSAQAVAPLFQVQSTTLEAAFDELQKRFGTLDDYLTKGLGVTQADVERLRARLVV